MTAKPTALVTGAAGFIGFHLSKALILQGYQVWGVDNLNQYYDPKLKRRRLALLQQQPDFNFVLLDISKRAAMPLLFRQHNFELVLHLAAQAGVRYSIEAPMAYLDSNIVGTMTVLEACRHHPPTHLLLASSSSVYGEQDQHPFAETDNTDCPVSLYAASKKAGEVLAYSYAKLYKLPITALRFFTVYGPWGRPDMALFKFVDAILHDQPIPLYNQGTMSRDFTYIDDLVQAVVSLCRQPSKQAVPYQVFNIGSNTPITLREFVGAIETATDRKANLQLLPLQPGDVFATWADNSKLSAAGHPIPHTPLQQGVTAFVEWYTQIYLPLQALSSTTTGDPAVKNV